MTELTKEQKEELEKFGANAWFVEYLYKQYKDSPENVPEQWKKFFGDTSVKGNGNGKQSLLFGTALENIALPMPEADDETKIIAGSTARILDNMTSSLSIPVATSQRTVPVKLLEENRIIINNHRNKNEEGKISFTHIISWAILKALMKYPVMNSAFTVVNGKPQIIKRKHVNLGLAIDIEKKDGSRSLIVPNIKNVETLTFKEFIQKYEDIVVRARNGQIDPSEFLGTTITLTNPGTLGTVVSVPRLMVGQGTIIAVGAIQYPAEYQAVSKTTISALGVSKVMNITSTYDHRIIQGAESGLFLKEISEQLLGNDNFYDEIFQSLNIPLQPLLWKTDYQPGAFSKGSNTEEIEKQARVLQLINMYRVRGHLIANLDPLSTQSYYHNELDPSYYKFTYWDYDREFITGGMPGAQSTATLREILDLLQKTYCEKIGIEFMHIQNPEQKRWLQERMEPIRNAPHMGNTIKKNILEKLIYAETFEHFIHRRFVGHKRFSLEGSETLIPVLDYLLNIAADDNIMEVVLGMAHRGRLNVLANIIGKPFDSIFYEFEDIRDPQSIQGSGDVKYHLGASGTYKTLNGRSINATLASNPSHLEWVNPVVEGITRAKQTRLGDKKQHKKIMSVLIHGDAAFAGQGVVAETLNLSQLTGYRTGGTVHIIINNQIGFTTTPEDARSSVYPSDVAKMIQSPIFHVNGDDPEAALWATKLAFDFRQEFKKDVVIDLFGYRRHGHNEGDEPGFTQPLLYDKIKNHPSVKTIYAEKLVKKNSVSQEEVDNIVNRFTESLNESLERTQKKETSFATDVPLAVSKEKVESISPVENTSINLETLKQIVTGITTLPNDFSVHPKLEKFLEGRRTFLENGNGSDWAFAETIAFGSLLLEGTPVRLSGQDSVRGTFSQRHLALTDIKTGDDYIPLNYINNKQAQIEPLDSLLSEAAVLGFEYGYSTADPLALVIWEAQFGDFANSAQVIIDNFIVASQEKWQIPNSLVLLLPHGYEGQGPEHSSARLERFLILCAEDNMQVCNPTTPAQYFHLLRRQIKRVEGRPLVIMTPKSLLRLPEARSTKEEFLRGRFLEVIDDNLQNKDEIEKVLVTSGKVYYDLLKHRKQNNLEEKVAIVRIEQYYPFDEDNVEYILRSYKNAKKIVWVQEEPGNMGAWSYLRPKLQDNIAADQKLFYAGRPESASPAYGSSRISMQQEKELLKKAFSL